MTTYKKASNFLADLIFGVRTVLADNGEAPQRPALEFVGVTYEDDEEEGVTRLIVTGEGGAPATRAIIAGAGLQGGGTLAGDVTLAARLRPFGTGGLTIYGDGIGAVTNANVGTEVVAGYGLGVRCAESEKK